jgi:hypothetical protein
VIDRIVMITELYLAVIAFEADLMPPGDRVSGNVDVGQQQRDVLMLYLVCIPDACARNRKTLDEEVDLLRGCVRIARQPRKIVAAAGIDDVVDVNVLDVARLENVATAEKIAEADIELRPTDGRKRR